MTTSCLPRLSFFVLCCVLFVGCEKPTVDVNLHGVNYSDRPFSYFVSEVKDLQAGGGGEIIDPFGAGGITCCVSLPRKWQPGIKLRVRTRYWLRQQPDGKLPEVVEEQLIDVPQYFGKAPGEIWVLRGADGKISVVSSDFQPDHPQWPGKVKGWPVPSIEYQRERWEIYRKHEEGGVALFQKLLTELDEMPAKRARDDWDFRMNDNKRELAGYSGPDDPRFRKFLQAEYERGLESAKARLDHVMEQRP